MLENAKNFSFISSMEEIPRVERVNFEAMIFDVQISVEELKNMFEWKRTHFNCNGECLARADVLRVRWLS